MIKEIHKNEEFYSKHIKDYSSLFRRQVCICSYDQFKILFKELHKRDFDKLSLQKMLMEEIEWIRSKQSMYDNWYYLSIDLEVESLWNSI